MGVWGAVIMGFFGAVFAALTMYWEWHVGGAWLALPFLMFACVAAAARHVMRVPGDAPAPSPKVERVILWSSVGEGVGLFLAGNIVMNLHRPELLLLAMALIVGLHFLPIAYAAAFRPFGVLGGALIAAAVVGVVTPAPTGGKIAGQMAAVCLWTAAMLALRRDWRANASGSSIHSAGAA